MWGALVFGRFWMLESVQHGGNVMWHGDIHIFVGVVPLDSQTAEEGALPIFGDRVQAP